jgi:transcriptional regulator with XRE-family HTH domain
MDFGQLHERVRMELLRRIRHGTASVSQLARQTGMGQPHISNFLRGRRRLSLAALDKVLHGQNLQIQDVMPEPRGELFDHQVGEVLRVALVPQGVAAADASFRTSTVLMSLPLPVALFQGLEARCPASRKGWERFAAVRMTAADAEGMEPVLRPDSVVILDRHYTSFRPAREGEVNLYGARFGSGLLIRYAQYLGDRVVLRAHDGRVPAEVLEATPGQTGSDLLVGRVALVVHLL